MAAWRRKAGVPLPQLLLLLLAEGESIPDRTSACFEAEERGAIWLVTS